MLRKAVEEIDEDESDEGYMLLEGMSDLVSSEMGKGGEPTEDTPEVEEETPKEKPAGLMSRGQNNGS